jgi:hypothetical protein
MFQALEERRDVDWKARFRESAGYASEVREPLSSADLVPIPVRPNIDPPPPPTPVVHQLGVLIRRYLAVIRADRGFALTLALQAPIFGLLFAAMFYFNVMLTSEALNASLLIWLIVIGATWLGTSNAIREIVKELPIYRRERAIGLSAGAYVLSKVVVLGLITAVQAAVLVPVSLLFQTLPAQNSPAQAALLIAAGIDPASANVDLATTGIVFGSQTTELILVAIIVGIASMALGLLISALIGGVDRASTLLPVVLVLQVIVSVPIVSGSSPVLQAIGYTMSARWGYGRRCVHHRPRRPPPALHPDDRDGPGRPRDRGPHALRAVHLAPRTSRLGRGRGDPARAHGGRPRGRLAGAPGDRSGPHGGPPQATPEAGRAGAGSGDLRPTPATTPARPPRGATGCT